MVVATIIEYVALESVPSNRLMIMPLQVVPVRLIVVTTIVVTVVTVMKVVPVPVSVPIKIPIVDYTILSIYSSFPYTSSFLISQRSIIIRKHVSTIFAPQI